MRIKIITVLLPLLLLLGFAASCSTSAKKEPSDAPGAYAESAGIDVSNSGTSPMVPSDTTSVDDGADIDSIVFTESSHKRSSEYAATFNTMTATYKNVTLHVRDTVFVLDTARCIMSRIINIYSAVNAIFPDNLRDITAYIVDLTVTGNIVCVNDKVFLTIDDAMSNNGFKAIASAFLGVTEPWQTVGIAAYITGIKADEQLIKDYYADTNNLAALSLFAAYFYSDYVGASTALAAEQTAISLTNYMLSAQELSAYLVNPHSVEIRQEWLDYLRIDTRYKTEYDLSFCNGAQYSSTLRYPLIITMPNEPHTFYIQLTEDFLQAPNEIIRLLHGYHYGMLQIIEDLRVRAPSSYDVILENWMHSIDIYCEVGNSTSSAGSGTVHIAGIPNIWHEICHLLLPPADIQRQIWLAEALPEYMSISLHIPVWIDDDFAILYDYLFEGENHTDPYNEDDYIYRDFIKVYYAARKDLPAISRDMDFMLFNEAAGVANLLYPELRTTIPFKAMRCTLYEMYGLTNLQSSPETTVEGMELTYPAAYVLLTYLVEEHGLDKVVAAYLDRTGFTEAFGRSYDETLADARQVFGTQQSQGSAD